MSAPLYFLPNSTLDAIAPGGRLDHRLLCDRGLGHVFGTPGSASRVKGTSADAAGVMLSGRGPGDLSGVVLCALPPSGSAPRRIGYYPKEQQWTPWLDGSQCWIGIDPSEPPGPGDLRRPHSISGHPVELADGNTYEIGIIRYPSGGDTNLPQTMGWNKSGAFELKVKPEYVPVWEAAERTHRLFYGFGTPEHGVISFEGALALALSTIGLNYRYGQIEQSVLQLVDTVNWEAVLAASVDWPSVKQRMERQKAGELEGADAGDEDDESIAPSK